VEVQAISADVQFRPARRAAWPRIYGYENGQVEGAGASDYAQIDDQGRYLVKMRFDEGNGHGARSSTWVRMMQPHGGGVEGFHFPLRKHTEVVVSFLGGDPDRPVISGVVPNALTPSPVTSGNHTKNVIQTGGRNRLELEDLAGQQRITLSTPYSNTYLRMGSPNDDHEAIIHTDDNALLHADVNYDVYAGVNMDVQVGTDYTNKVTAGKYFIDVHAGPFKLHTLANTIDLISNTDFRLESETAHGNIDAKTFLFLDAKTDYGFFHSQTNMSLKSRAADLSAVGNQNVLVQAENATGTFRSKGKLTLHSTDTDAELHAATGLNIHTDANGIEMEAPADINIHSIGGMVNVTSGGQSTFNFSGDQTTINKAKSSTFTYGSARSIRLGTDATYSLTMKTELSAGLSFAIKASLAMEVSAAMSVKMTVFKAELETLKQTMCVLNNANHGVNIRGAAAWLGTHGFKGNVGGIELHA
jgi:type VI secretion system secreted protein VgrG